MSSCRCLATKSDRKEILGVRCNDYFRFAFGFAILILSTRLSLAIEPPVVDGNQTLSIECDGSPLTITTTSRLAGAVDSLRWRNHEFIDSADHGRQLQSACSFDAMSDEPFWAVRFNPTEAGSRLDGAG